MHIGVCSLGSDTRKVHRRRRSLLDMGKSSGSCSKAQGLIVYPIPFSIFRSSSHLCLCSSTTPSSIPTFTSSSIYTTLAQHQSPTRSPTPSPPPLRTTTPSPTIHPKPPPPHRLRVQEPRPHSLNHVLGRHHALRIEVRQRHEEDIARREACACEDGGGDAVRHCEVGFGSLGLVYSSLGVASVV